MLKILLYGHGKMGKMVEEIITEQDDMELVAIVSPSYNKSIYDITEAFDVIIDFSVPQAICEIAQYSKAYKTPLVLAVTGYNDEQERIIADLAEKVPVFRAENLSYGIKIMKNLINTAMQYRYDDIEITETHHNRKKDAPSGTALSLADLIGENIPIHSLRLGNVAGGHIVSLAMGDELITISHTALSRRIFAQGALKAARFITNCPPGIYGMDNIP